jgi:hypothetical protein
MIASTVMVIMTRGMMRKSYIINFSYENIYIIIMIIIINIISVVIAAE